MNNKEEEEILRKQAIVLHLQGLSVQEISSQLNRSRQWVYKWIKRHSASPEKENWHQAHSNAPKNIRNRIPNETETAIINIRKELESNPYHQNGAVNIFYKLNEAGIKPPSTATINRVIKRNGLQNKSRGKMRKNAEYPSSFINVQQMDLIGPCYLKGGFKFYFYSIMDVETHHAEVYPVKNKSAKSIVPCLIDFWENFQLPDFLQMDNELSFRGSNKHPRSLGLLLKVALSYGVTPVFIPPAEPWRNGVIEKFNHNVEKRFFASRIFSGFEEIKDEAATFSNFHNANHRYGYIRNRTPNQVTDPPEKRWKLSRKIDLNAKIPVEEGSLIFIRFIRSDLKLHILDAVFIVNEELKYSYVMAEIILDKFVLVVSRNHIIFHYFPFAMNLPK